MSTTCSICKKNKERLYVRSSPSGVKQYKDLDNRAWKGKKCPDCLKAEHRDYMRKARGSNLGHLTCHKCEKGFEQKRGHQIFCSKECRITSK